MWWRKKVDSFHSTKLKLDANEATSVSHPMRPSDSDAFLPRAPVPLYTRRSVGNRLAEHQRPGKAIKRTIWGMQPVIRIGQLSEDYIATFDWSRCASPITRIPRRDVYASRHDHVTYVLHHGNGSRPIESIRRVRYVDKFTCDAELHPSLDRPHL